MKGWKRRFFGWFLAVVLTAQGLFVQAGAHPQAVNVMTSFPDGWSFHYADGHTSKGGYFHIRETGERLICLEPHLNTVASTRDHWVTLTQYFNNDAAFARKLSLIAYYGENSGWGLDGWAAAQSLIWKYIMERNGEAGEQWISTNTMTGREQLQVYYDAIEQKISAYNKVPDFHDQTITLQAGESRTLTDTNGALSDMNMESSGPIRVLKEGNSLTITAVGTDAGTGTVRFKKELSGGWEGDNFAYPADGFQDLMTCGAYEPVHAALTVRVTEAPVSMEFSKQELTTGKELPGASLQVTDKSGKVVDAWISGTEPHRIRNLKNGETYTLTETLPAPGYATAQSITFTASHGAAPVVMKDDVTRIRVLKTDLTTGRELSGAALQVTDRKGNVIDRWISGVEPHVITKLTAGETYILTETAPAPGYATAQSVAFTVADTGKVQKVEMRDDITRVEISKKDLTTGEELPGASLQVTDGSGKVIDRWVSGKTPHSITKLTVGETYILTETVPAPGYVTARSAAFTVKDTGKVQKVEMRDDITRVEISKKDLTTGEELPGAALQITDSEGRVIDAWISGETPHSVTKLTAGETYILTETAPAPGYVTARSAAFTVKDTGEIQKIQMEDDITRICIQKTGLSVSREEKEAAMGAVRKEERAGETREEPEGLAGAVLQVRDASGTIIDKWTTDGKPHILEKLTAGETYLLEELSPAPGYATAEPVEFTVEDTAEIQWVVMEDEITKTEISKKDITNGKELPGASLRLTDAEGKTVDEWISEETPHRITKLVAGKTYTLTEIRPADGYVTAEAVTFTVEDTGVVQQVSMEDDITRTEVSKVDTADGEALPGALLQILDGTGRVVLEWTSGEEPRLIERLTAGETYLLHEAEAPEGYLTAADVEFTVSDTGEGQTVAMEDELAVINLEVAKRTIRRTQTGDTYKYTITTLKNASNTALENFTCTDYLPEQVIMRELHTGTFSDELEYSIAYQTNRSQEWHPLERGLNSKANHIISFASLPLKEGEQVTAYRYEFGTAPAGFGIAEQNPVYFTTVKPGVDVLEEMLTDIILSGDWRGVSVTDKDDTLTLLFEGKIEPARSFGRIVSGDASPIADLTVLAAVSAGTLMVLFVRRRKALRSP